MKKWLRFKLRSTASDAESPELIAFRRFISLQCKSLAGKKLSRKRRAILVLGEKNAGKSACFQHANLLNLQMMSGGENEYLIHITEEALWIKLPSRYLSDEQLQARIPVIAQVLQKEFNICITTALVVINVTSLSEKTKEEQLKFIQQVQHIIQLYAHTDHTIVPVQFLVTHSDKILGFNEFFAELNEQEREQSFGVEFSQLLKDEALLQAFSNEYFLLLNQLHAKTISRMHRERSLQKRQLIKEFPLQLEALRPVLQGFLTQWMRNSSHIEVLGIYFCSFMQASANVDRLAKAVKLHLNVEPFPSRKIPLQRKVFFVKELFSHTLLAQQTFGAHSTWSAQHLWLINRGIYVIAAGCLVIGLWFLTAHFRHTMNKLQNAEYAMQTFQFITQQHFETPEQKIKQTFAALNELNKVMSAFKMAHQHHLLKRAELAYAQSLQTRFLPWVINYLSNQLKEREESPSGELYELLKAYLMLGNIAHKQDAYLKTVLFDAWDKDQLLSNKNRILLKKYLLDALVYQKVSLALDEKLVINVRKTLLTLPYPMLAYLNLKNQQTEEGLHLIKSDQGMQVYPIFSSLKEYTVPGLYTKERFRDVYKGLIPKISENASEGDWVLGKHAVDDDMPDRQQLITALRAFYVTDYVNYWNLSLVNLDFSAFKNFAAASHMIKQLYGTESPLYQVLQNLIENTSAIAGHSETDQAFNQLIAARFAKVNQWLANEKDKKQILKKIDRNLKLLAAEMESINESGDPAQAAFNEVRNRYLHKNKANDPLTQLNLLADKMPQPIKQWLQTVSFNSWKLMLIHAQTYINQIWAKKVWPIYFAKLQNRYPLFKTAQSEIKLEEFSRFFAPKGIIDNFFTTYIEPFVDMSQAQWRNIELNQLSLQFSDSVLQQFERARLIKQMFFKTAQNKMQIEFNMQPLVFDQSMKKVSLSINDQLLEDEQNENTVSHFVWPGDVKTPLVQLEFNSIEGQFSSVTTEGEWAWFRLLDESHIQIDKSDTKKYRILFDINGLTAKYQLTAKDTLNPFIPHIVDGFRAPMVLLFSTDKTYESVISEDNLLSK